MNTQLKELFMQATSLMLVIWLTAGLLLMGDWFNASLCQARGERGPNGGAAARGPNGGGAARGPNGGTAARGPNGGTAARGPNGGAAARGPNGQVVAAPRGRVAPPVYPAAGVRPVPVPVPVAPAYYAPNTSGVAAGMVLGAMLTALPAAAVAKSSQGTTIYVSDNKCYKEVKKDGTTYYEQISCP